MKLLLFFVASLAYCQVTITVNSVNSIQDRAARVNMTLSAPATIYAEFGLTTSYGNRSNVAVSGTTNAVLNLFGLTPGTVNNYRICQTGHTPPTGCTANQTVTTLAAYNPTPTLPTDYAPAMPSSYAATYAVDANCSNLQAHLDTVKALDGNNNYLITIPAGTYCGYQWTLPAKTGANPNGTGTVVISTTGTLPPEGTRITPDYENQLAIFLQPSIIFDTMDPSCDNFSILYRFDLDLNKVCRSTNTWTLVSAEPGFTSGVGPPSPLTGCVAGRFYRNTSGGTAGLWYCHGPSNRWQQTHSTNGAGYAIATASGAKGYRLVGIKFENLFPNQWMQYANLDFNTGSSNILCDRCFLKWSNGFQGAAGSVNGANVGWINSHIDVLPRLNQAPGLNVTAGTGPFVIRNNYLRSCFIPIFINDNNATVPRADITVAGNEITMNEKCNPRSPNYDGVGDRDPRAAMEIKRGVRILIAGNIFHDWSPGGAPINGAAILMTPRAGPSTGGDDNDYGISDVTIRANRFYRGTGGIEIWGSDDQWYRNTRPGNRLLVENNLGYDVDGLTYYWISATRGPFLYVQDGFSNVTVRNNTWVNHKGTGPAIMTFTAPIGNLNITRNILWLSQGLGLSGGDDGGGIRWAAGTFSTLCNGSTAVVGSTAATKLNLCALPSYAMTTNAIVGGMAGYTATFQPGYPSGNYWPGDTSSGLTALGFYGDYRLKFTSTYAPFGVGADVNAIDSETGVTSNLRQTAYGSTTASVSYKAPVASRGCTVEYGVSAVPGTGVRVTDTPGSRFRTVALTGLTSNTTYNYRVYCAQMVTGTFVTN